VGGTRGRRLNQEIKQACLDLSKEAQESGCRLKIVCQDLGVDLKTINRWESSIEDQRRGPLTKPANKLSDAERDLIIKTATSKEYQDQSPWYIVPSLADQGIYLASEATFYRVLKQESLLAHRRRSKKPSHKKPKPLTAKAPNQVWSWDITYLMSTIKGQYYYLYMFMDIFSRKIVGWEVYACESMDYSASLFATICDEENIDQRQLALHSDNGAAMKGATMLATMQKFGVIPSFSRPSVSDDNPFSESLFKTLKYCPEYPAKPFETIEEARAWVKSFVDWYNNQHLHSGIKFVTPSQRHQGKDKEILSNRKKVYETAKQKNLNRWSGKTRNWNFIDEVFLNHLPKEPVMDTKIAA